jgi:hypothetical protein
MDPIKEIALAHAVCIAGPSTTSPEIVVAAARQFENYLKGDADLPATPAE